MSNRVEKYFPDPGDKINMVYVMGGRIRGKLRSLRLPASDPSANTPLRGCFTSQGEVMQFIQKVMLGSENKQEQQQQKNQNT